MKLTAILICALLAGNVLAAELTRDGQQAFESLKRATIFRFGNGLVGGMSPSQLSVVKLLKEDQSKEVFQALIGQAAQAGQLYALTVQRQFDLKRFQKNVTDYLQATNEVEVMEGCIIRSRKVSAIAKEIQDGRFLGWPEN